MTGLGMYGGAAEPEIPPFTQDDLLDLLRGRNPVEALIIFSFAFSSPEELLRLTGGPH